MRFSALVGIGLATLVVVAGFAQSHDKTYVGTRSGDGTEGLSCLKKAVADRAAADLIGFGGVCYPGGHVVPLGGSAVLDITDFVFTLVPATYCQDLNGDLLCGGDATGPAETEAGGNPSPICQGTHSEGAAGCSFRSEPYVDFCDSITIFGGLTGPLAQGSRRVGSVSPGTSGSGDWADPSLDNWDTTEAIFVLVRGSHAGNPTQPNVCGSLATSGTAGTVSHS